MSRVTIAIVVVLLAIGVALLWRSSRAIEFLPRMTVAPRDAKVFAGNSLQFHTSLIGESERLSVHWSVVGPGSIDSSGLYHAADVPATADVVASAGNGVVDSTSVQTVTPPKRGDALLLETCYEDGTVNVNNARNFALAGGLSVGGRAAGITVDSAWRRAFFAVEGQIVAIDLDSMRWRVSAAVPGARFSEIALLADGLLAATDNNATAGHPGVRIFRVTGQVPVLVSSVIAGETPEGLTAADAGRSFYVSNINGNSIMRFSVSANGRARMTAVGKTAARPFGIAVDPTRHILFVADNDTTVVSGSRARPGLERFSTPDLRRIGSIVSTGSVSSLPLGVAVDASQARVFVTNEGEQDVAVFSLPGMQRIATLPTGLTPWLPAFDPVLHRLYVPNARADSVSVLDTQTLRVVAKAIPTCSYPTSLAVFYPRAVR